MRVSRLLLSLARKQPRALFDRRATVWDEKRAMHRHLVGPIRRNLVYRDIYNDPFSVSAPAAFRRSLNPGARERCVEMEFSFIKRILLVVYKINVLFENSLTLFISR